MSAYDYYGPIPERRWNKNEYLERAGRDRTEPARHAFFLAFCLGSPTNRTRDKACQVPAVGAYRRQLEYKFPFVTLAGFHALNLSMFHLASGYAQSGMSAYSKLQQEEFAAQELGYRAVTHQRFVGTGYFDEIAQVVAGGKSSTTALAGSTEAEQFQEALAV